MEPKELGALFRETKRVRAANREEVVRRDAERREMEMNENRRIERELAITVIPYLQQVNGEFDYALKIERLSWRESIFEAVLVTMPGIGWLRIGRERGRVVVTSSLGKPAVEINRCEDLTRENIGKLLVQLIDQRPAGQK